MGKINPELDADMSIQIFQAYYRACCMYITKKSPLSYDKGLFKNKIKTGGGLLSRVSSTIGAGGLNFCVRNGNR